MYKEDKKPDFIDYCAITISFVAVVLALIVAIPFWLVVYAVNKLKSKKDIVVEKVDRW